MQICRVLESDFNYVKNSVKQISNLKNKSVLVTGATGLIGSLVINFLRYLNVTENYGITLYAVVRSEVKAAKKFGDYSNDGNLKVLKCDLSCDDLSLDGEVDYVIHTASITASKEMIENPQKVFDVAVSGTQKALQLAVQKNVKKLIYLSSMEAYGTMPTDEKTTEDKIGYVDESNPRSAYPISKRACEALCKDYFQRYSVPTVSLRLAQTFGAGVDFNDGRVFNQFAKSVMFGNDIVLHTDGLSHGNYVYTADCLSAIFLLLFVGADGETYNVVNEECHTTILGMAKTVCSEVAKDKISVVIQPDTANTHGYAPKTVLNLSSKKLNALGWRATVSLPDAYERLIEYYKEIHAN